MWKKVKRILSCMLALILLLSLIDGQQFFVRAESEVKATQTEQASNKMEETETSSGKEEGSEANNKENGKQEEGTQKEELSTKATEKTTETKNEDGKVDKPDNLNKENENNGQENGGKNEEKETGDKGEETTKEKAEEASAEEDTAQETEAKKQIDATDDTQERTNQQDENVPAMAQRGTDVSEKETEYVPKSQPQGVSIKVYAKENVFPEGTTMTVKELTNKELDSAQNVLEKGNVSYDGFLGYDISFYNKEGKEIEPEEGSVRVEVDMNLNLLPKDLQMDTLQMQHLKEEKKDRTVETVAKAADHKLSVSKSKVTAKFEVKSFSDFILTWNIDATPADPLETGDNAASIEKQINHEKYATLRDDGTYDLTLTVAGKKGTETNKAKLDVIYILDKSGSMKEDFGGTSKRIAASNAITALTKSLKQNVNIDARFSMVTFSGNKTTGMWGQGDTKTWDDAEVAVSWTTDAGTIERGSKPTSNGGTNYQAGIRTAKELLTSKRAGAMTAVIFISDGDPTFYYNPDGYTRGDGNNDGNGGADNLKVCLDAAKNEIANLGVNYFYTVGVGKASDYVNLSDLCSASGVSGAKNFDGTNTDNWVGTPGRNGTCVVSYDKNKGVIFTWSGGIDVAVRPTYNGKLDETLTTLKKGYKRIGDANMNNNKAFFSNQTFYINGERYTTRVYYADSSAFKDALIGYTPKPASYDQSPFRKVEHDYDHFTHQGFAYYTYGEGGTINMFTYVNENKVYQTTDEGNTWQDITPNEK